MGPGVPSREVNSWHSDWDPWALDDPCDPFIADIDVPSTSSGGVGYSSKFSVYARPAESGPLVSSNANEIPLSHDVCVGPYRLGYTVYRRNPNQRTFLFVGSRSFVSRWVSATLVAPAYCILEPSEWDGELPAEFTPPASGTATYRVVAWAGSFVYGPFDAWHSVNVGAKHARLL